MTKGNVKLIRMAAREAQPRESHYDATAALTELCRSALLHWGEARRLADELLLHRTRATAAEIELAEFLTSGPGAVVMRWAPLYGSFDGSGVLDDPSGSYEFSIQELARAALRGMEVKETRLANLVLALVSAETGCGEDGPAGPRYFDDNWPLGVWYLARKAAGLPAGRRPGHQMPRRKLGPRLIARQQRAL